MRQKADYWIEQIAEHELPAITSTVRLLDKFSTDDVSSLPKLSQAILHDQALSSCILKVANSIPHFGVAKVTTVSRASVVLGIQAVKNICLTSKLIDGLLKNKNLQPEIYKRLSRLMATSFHSALLAKMMMSDYGEETQEEVYLATLLYRIGETAFWGVGGKNTEKLIDKVNLPTTEFEQECVKVLGTNFRMLSVSLANAWNLGDLLVKALDAPQSRTVEVQIIYLADKLARYIERPPSSVREYNILLDDIAKIMHLTPRQLKKRIEAIREDAMTLLDSYGASTLVSYLKKLPTIDDFQHQSQEPLVSEISREKAQLNAIQGLTKLTSSSHDLNQFLQYALKSIATTYGFDRCVFYMLMMDKQYVRARFSVNKSGHADNFTAQVNVTLTKNLFKKVLDNKTPVVVNNVRDTEIREYISLDIARIIDDGVICMAPVFINKNCIGVISAQNFDKEIEISADDFSQFCFFIEHLNMCLRFITK